MGRTSEDQAGRPVRLLGDKLLGDELLGDELLGGERKAHRRSCVQPTAGRDDIRPYSSIWALPGVERGAICAT
ncbi:hypothetical protein [Deinococcus sp.]|uniref:hypothetical protein n=1 Tax=Deinococcus sp. TaxID=47478 RepID=UPI0025E32A58|nr:hypothetical protein [Deinococcus sp.]